MVIFLCALILRSTAIIPRRTRSQRLPPQIRQITLRTYDYSDPRGDFLPRNFHRWDINPLVTVYPLTSQQCIPTLIDFIRNRI